jgi:NADP-dependent 3-hydroxy acid dehydrogenase YdfG
MARSLAGAVVAVTGASSGIGRATALAFAREGARVALCARRMDRLEELAAAIRVLGAEALAREVDVAREEDVRAFVAAAVERWGRLDVMVNNAGYGVRGRVEDTPAHDYRRLMEVNYLGTVYGCQAAIPVMRRQKSGVIINVSSIVGHRALPGGAAYGASKAAQISLTESLRVELAGSGVAVCSVHPIGTSTEFADVAARLSPGRPGGPMGPQQTVDDVARAIVTCARRPRPEMYPHRLSRGVVWLNALAPRLVDWMAVRAARRAGRL